MPRFRGSQRDDNQPEKAGRAGKAPRGRAGYAPDDSHKERATEIEHGRRPGREGKPGTGPDRGR